MPGIAAALGCLLACWQPAASAPTAAEIMAQVARNQDRAQQARAGFLYQQRVQIRLHRGNRKLAREEVYQFQVTPGPQGTEKARTAFSGKYADKKGKLIPYDEPGHTYKEIDIDGELASDLALDLSSDERTRDGLAANLFPLTGTEQTKYRFRLEGRQQYQDREVYRITFKPSSKEDGAWAGEVLVDAEQFQPVLITTRLGRGIPFAVKTLLGTNLKHLGFKVSYREFEPGIWFPVSYGGEFELRAVFFYKRIISFSLANSGFQRTDVQSQIRYGEPAAQQ